MDILKGNNKRKTKQYLISVDKKTHEILRDLSYQNKLTRGEIVKKAINIYQKATIFDNLI